MKHVAAQRKGLKELEGCPCGGSRIEGGRHVKKLQKRQSLKGCLFALHTAAGASFLAGIVVDVATLCLLGV